MLKPKIFISYKRKHQPTLHAIETIEAALRAANFDILRDTNMEPGERWSNELYAWLLECSGAIAIIGEEAAKSEWCRREWWFLRERHHSSGLPVIPICLGDEVESAGILDDLQALFFGTNAGDDIVSRLSAVRAIKASAKDYLAAHHSWLRWQFTEAPVLGREPFSLSEVYVETECGDLSWRQIADDKPLDPFVDEEEHGGRKPLVEAVMSLVCDAQYREPIIVQGSPGSGKSAFTLKLANELLKQDLKPLLVRFRDLRLTTFDSVDELLEDGLRIGPVEEEPPRPDGSIISETLNVLKRGAKASIPQLVVILDGWDEVSLTGNTSYKAQLQSWLPKIREYFVERPGPAVRLVLTGRPSVEVRASGVLKRDTRVLTVRHMSPSQLKGFADRIKLLASRKKADSDTGWTLDLQRLQGVFGQYDSWFKRDSNRRKGGESFDVIGNPLLALLTFRTLADWKGDPSDLIKKPTALYHALVDATVQHAGKGKDDDLRDTVHRGGEALRRLLQKVASVISILGREAVSFAELKYRLDEDPSLAEWCRDLSRSVSDAAKENALYELVVNFYFKGGNTGLGCEFLHKSFREYLFAEAIVETLKTLSSDQADRGATAQTIQYWQDFPDGSPPSLQQVGS